MILYLSQSLVIFIVLASLHARYFRRDCLFRLLLIHGCWKLFFVGTCFSIMVIRCWCTDCHICLTQSVSNLAQHLLVSSRMAAKSVFFQMLIFLAISMASSPRSPVSPGLDMNQSKWFRTPRLACMVAFQSLN